jgi:S1-C subfamily serine protease
MDVTALTADPATLSLSRWRPTLQSTWLFESAAADVNVPDHTPRAAHGLGLTVQELSPEIANYFTAKPDTALLVADVSAEAARAGVSRGDLVTAIGASQIHNLTDFNRNLARLERGQAVKVTIERDGRARNVTLRAT